MEKIIITIDNRNSLIVEHEYPAKNPQEAAQALNTYMKQMHRQDQIVGIETQ